MDGIAGAFRHRLDKPLDGRALPDGDRTRPAGEVAETVLGIATVDEAILGLAANSIEKAIITTAPSLEPRSSSCG